MNPWFRLVSVVAAGAVALGGAEAQAHWCHDLWGTAYNLVVRPAADTVNVPGGGSATLDVYVQNNMGYPLKNFVLTAQATGYTLSVSRQAPKVTGFLMPGESLRHTLTISAASASTLSVQALDFLVNFGEGTQDQAYGGVGKAAMVKQASGAIFPARTVPGLNQTQGMNQATHLISSAAADYGDLAVSLDRLMTEFCTGRGSWDTGGGLPSGTCTPTGATTCPAPVTRGHTKYDWQHLWASQEAVIRKSALGARTATLRERLKCAWADSNPAFRWFAAMMLGYLGEDPGARTFLTGLITSGTTSADDKLVAKAALLLFKAAADKTTWGADVTAGLGYTGSANSDYVQMACATTLGITDRNDTAVSTKLISRAGWVEPDTADNGKNFVAAHLLNLVAWDRRGWAIEAGDTGAVSFYGSAPPDTIAPRAPATTSCTAQSNGTIRVNWSQVTLDVNGGAENVTGYRIYRGTTARPAAAARPGEQGFDYDHVDPTSSIYFDFPGLPGTSLHYFTVTALDAAGNASVYGQQVSCTPRYPPVAVIACTPLSGLAPLAVSCDSAGSTDPNGAADLTTRSFELVGGATQAQAQVSYNFPTASSNLVRLTVTDSTGLSSSASATIVATTAGNTPPTAAASATPLSGPAPLAVTFSSAGSTDPDVGQTLSYRWDFGDGSAASTVANPSHTYLTPGTHLARLTVTDSATPPAPATAQVTIAVAGNAPPDLSSVSASPRAGAAPLLVSFDASGVTDPEGRALQLSWSFGDGSANSTTALATHSYPAAGTFTATLTVTDTGTPVIAPLTATFTITVAPPGTQNRPPDCAGATVTPLSGPAPLQLMMDATGCTDPDGNALAFTWRVPTSFTTEETFSTAQAQFELLVPGSYTIKLAAVDDAASPTETNRTFPVVVTEARLPAGEMVGVCGCQATSAPILLGALAALVLCFRRGRRR